MSSALRFWGQVIAMLVVMVAGFELLCRLVINDTPEIIHDPRFGPITEPDHIQLQSNEGWARNRTNELGNVDDAMPHPLPADGILVIGDSFTQADQVAMSRRYTNLLGATLHRRVYNAGHGSWSLLNHIAYLRTNLSKFAPSTVVVQLSGNDLNEMVNSSQAHLVVRADGSSEIAIPRLKNSRMHDLVMTKSAFVRRFVQRLRSVLFRKRDANDTSSDDVQISAVAVRALPALLADLRRIHPDVRMLYLPTLDYQGGCVDRWRAARESLEVAARAANMPFVNATDVLCRRFADTRQPMHGFWNTLPGEGHMNERGHAVVAGLLANTFEP